MSEQKRRGQPVKVDKPSAPVVEPLRTVPEQEQGRYDVPDFRMSHGEPGEWVWTEYY